MLVGEILGQPRPSFSFEFFPPKDDAGVSRLLATAQHLAELQPAFVSLTCGAGGSQRSRTVDLCAQIERETGLLSVAHLTCVGHSRDELVRLCDLVGQYGLKNVLALRGDPPKGQASFKPVEGGLSYASELVSLLKQSSELCVGAACYPEGHVEAPSKDQDLDHLVEKVRAGSDFLITQLFFENSSYFEFVKKIRERGISVPVVPGLMPVTNVEQLDRFSQMCGATIPQELRTKLSRVAGDEQAVMAVGIEWAIKQGRELLQFGAPGIHFYTLNRSLATRVVCYSLMSGTR